MRPAGAMPRGAVTLVWQTLRDFRKHLGHLMVITLFLYAVLAVPVAVSFVLVFFLIRGGSAWAGNLILLFLLPLVIPLCVGQSWAFLLVIQRGSVKVREVLRPFCRLSIYLRVLVAGSVPAAGTGLVWLTSYLGGLCCPGPLLPEHPLVESLVRSLAAQMLWLVVLPFTFAGLHVLVTGCLARQALAGSLRFCLRHWPLLVGYAVVFTLGWLPISATVPLLSAVSQSTQGAGACALALVPLVWSVLVVTVYMFLTLLNAEFYREFVWREREAGRLAAGA